MTKSLFDLTDRTLAALVAGLERNHAGEDGVTETLTRVNAQDYTQRGGPMVPAKRDPLLLVTSVRSR